MRPVNPKVTVIVPVYNVEPYIRQCLESLTAQTLEHIQIIVVDDGTPDSSAAIAEEFAKRDPRIEVIHQENQGLGPARNTGLMHARGEYVGFVDSDDWVHPNMFENLVKAAQDAHADIAIGGKEIWTDGKFVRRVSHPFAGKAMSGDSEIESCRKLLYGRLPHDNCSLPYPVAVTLGIYRRTLVESADVRFLDILSEDVFFNITAFAAANIIVHTTDCHYRYRKDRQESITRKFTPETVDRYVDFFEALSRYGSAERNPSEYVLRARRKMVEYSRSFVFMVETSAMTNSDKTRAISVLLDTRVFQRYCVTYPVDSFPYTQRLFHNLLVARHVKLALLLTRIRMILRGDR